MKVAVVSTDGAEAPSRLMLVSSRRASDPRQMRVYGIAGDRSVALWFGRGLPNDGPAQARSIASEAAMGIVVRMGWDERPRDPQRLRGFAIVGRMIRRKRMWLGWSQRMLGGQAGIDQSVISRLENGRQYGLHWKRFADIVSALDGFDLVSRSRSEAPPQPSARDPMRRRTVIDLELGPEDEADDGQRSAIDLPGHG